MFALACFAHWYESALYVAPVLVVGGGLWFAGHRMPSDDGPDVWEYADDDPAWDELDRPSAASAVTVTPRSSAV